MVEVNRQLQNHREWKDTNQKVIDMIHTGDARVIGTYSNSSTQSTALPVQTSNQTYSTNSNPNYQTINRPPTAIQTQESDYSKYKTSFSSSGYSQPDWMKGFSFNPAKAQTGQWNA